MQSSYLSRFARQALVSVHTVCSITNSRRRQERQRDSELGLLESSPAEPQGTTASYPSRAIFSLKMSSWALFEQAGEQIDEKNREIQRKTRHEVIKRARRK
jgi:hypothetical protein